MKFVFWGMSSNRKCQNLQHALQCVKLGFWVMGTGLLIYAEHNVARAFTTNLWCGYIFFFPQRHETRLLPLYVPHVIICKRNRASIGALFKGILLVASAVYKHTYTTLEIRGVPCFLSFLNDRWLLFSNFFLEKLRTANSLNAIMDYLCMHCYDLVQEVLRLRWRTCEQTMCLNVHTST